MRIAYSLSLCRLVISFSTFSIFFQVKMVNHYEVRVIFQDIEHQENIIHHFLHYSFL